MKAAVLIEPGKVEIRQVADAAAKPGEVLIEVKSCGVCATDVKKFTGASKAPFLPFILGHEPAGIITNLGDDSIKHLAPGDRVAVAPVITCGHCAGCQSGRTALEGMGMCENYVVVGFSMNGAFCERIAVPVQNVVKIPDSLAFKDAAIIEPVAACANGVLRSAGTTPGCAVVLGAGFMGLVCLQLYKVLGYRILISDLLPERLELAKQLGADRVMHAQEEDVEKIVHEFTGGLGADSVLCAIGSQPISESAIRMARKGGRVVMLASAGHDTQVSFNLNKLHYDQTIITGSVSYTNTSYQWALELMSQGRLGCEHLISATGKLDEVADLLAKTRDHVGIKNVALY